MKFFYFCHIIKPRPLYLLDTMEYKPKLFRKFLAKNITIKYNKTKKIYGKDVDFDGVCTNKCTA